MKYTERRHHSHSCKLHMTNHQESPYICDGCNQIGLGLSFSCERCSYDLHPDCISASSSMRHPYYKTSNFKFHDRPPGVRERFCDGCGGDIKGFSYHCDRSCRDLHPCCSKLPSQIEHEGVKLLLQEKLASKCSWCGKRRLWDQVTGWSYVSTCDSFQFHVNCVKEMLVKFWESRHFNCVNAARIEFGDNGRDNCDDGRKKSLAMEHSVVGNRERRMVISTRIQDKVQKYWRIARLVMRMIASTILGDPTSATAWLIESLVSSA
ncbi:uncharacterized protein LOC113293505 [Papaver somniferum]|nr:uncharacterized protein LOC113293505 [Papaver somniferum]